MKKAMCYLLICAAVITVFAGCGRIKETAAAENTDMMIAEQPDEKEEQIPSEKETSETERQLITEEQALDAIRTYCYSVNPDLESIANAGKYPVYWEIASGDEHEIVVLFRSYTGAQNRYYIDRNTGDTYVTEFVPGITSEEAQTDEHFNVSDYL